MESIMNIETPWGKADSVEIIADGIYTVSTPSHGGILLLPERLAAMPDYMGRPLFLDLYATYEEDCDWCMPAIVFEKEFRAYYAARSINANHALRDAQSTLRHWHPEAYQTFYGITLKPGESYIRDEQRFYAENKDSLLTIAAYGDWKDGVPKGMVAVSARPGGRANKDIAPTRYFLVPKNEYTPASRFPFLVDPDKYQEIPPLQ
jgi:hypothetical protein